MASLHSQTASLPVPPLFSSGYVILCLPACLHDLSLTFSIISIFDLSQLNLLHHPLTLLFLTPFLLYHSSLFLLPLQPEILPLS